jgi:soluble lytic murein transglycosylase-like protein
MGCKSHLSFFSIFFLLTIAALGSNAIIQKSFAGETSNSEIMGKKYITFYQDFLKYKDQQEIKSLEDIKKQALKEKKNGDLIYLYLGLLNVALESDEKNYAEFAIKYLKTHKKKMNEIQLDIFKIYFAKFLYKNKDYSGSILLLKLISTKQKSILFPIAAPLYLDSLLDLGLKAEALDFYKINRAVIEQNTNWEKLNELFVKLSNAALFFNKPNLALLFLKKPLLFYPQEKSGREAMDILSKIECAGGSIGSLYFRDENMQYLSKEVYKRIGKQSDSRNYILALVGIDPLNPIPSQLVETLSQQEKEKLLGIADLLMSAREYQIADSVLNYLSQSGRYSDPYNKDKILDMRGRVFNALHKPLQAAQVYYKLFTELPYSKLADTAKMKYTMSLHFAQKHSEAASFTSKNIVYPSIEDQNRFLFWQYYLSSQLKEAETIANNYLSQNSSNIRFQYWLSIIEKDRNEKDASIKRLSDIAQKTTDYPYPILSRWRLRDILFKNNNVSLNSSLKFKDFYIAQTNPFLRKKLKEKNLEYIRQLVSYNLNDIAILNIKKVDIKKLKKNRVIILANLAYTAMDFKMASDLSRNYFPNNLDDYNVEAIWTEKTNFWKLNFPLAYWPDIQNASKLADIDPFWLLSIMRAESAYYPQAESSVGAIGLMQIMPYTGINISKHIGKEDFNISLLKDPGQSIAFAAWYLRMLLKIYKGNYLLATAAYNSGPEAVNRWIGQNNSLTIDEFYENIPFQETKKYVAKVLGYLDIYYRVQLGNSEGYNLDVGESLPAPYTNLNIF